MKRLWTPWRMAYILGGEKRVTGCPFCAAIKGEDAEGYILYRGEHCFVILNRYPYNNGHLMVVPYTHVSSLEDLPSEAALELMTLVQVSLRILRAAYTPGGFNLGVNEGQAAGAGIAAHVHFHIVPRWEGDSNYMSVVGETRVMPEMLDASYARLHPYFERESDKARRQRGGEASR